MSEKVLLLKGRSYTKLKEAGSFGHPIHELFPQLQAILTIELGVEAAGLLAEPVVDQQYKRIDWYAEGDGDAIPYAHLTVEQQQQVMARVHTLLASAHTVATKYLHDPDDSRKQYGVALQAALTSPIPTHLFLVNGKPVITFWGFSHEQEGSPNVQVMAEPANLPDEQAENPTQSPTQQSAPGSAAGELMSERLHFIVIAGKLFWGVVVFSVVALLVVAVLRLLGVLPSQHEVSSPTLPPVGGGGVLVSPDFVRLLHAQQEELSLRSELQTLHDDFVERRLQCVLPQKSVPLLSDQPSVEKPSVSPPPQPSKKPEAPLVIPKTACGKGDLGFLAGRWKSRVNLTAVRVHTGEKLGPYDIFYDLAPKGEGSSTRHLHEKGVKCQSKDIKSYFDEKCSLIIEEKSSARCDDNSLFLKMKITCGQPENGKADCKAEQENGEKFDVPMERQKR